MKIKFKDLVAAFDARDKAGRPVTSKGVDHLNPRRMSFRFVPPARIANGTRRDYEQWLLSCTDRLANTAISEVQEASAASFSGSLPEALGKYFHWRLRPNKNPVTSNPVGVYWLLGSRILILSWGPQHGPVLMIKWWQRPSKSLSGEPK